MWRKFKSSTLSGFTLYHFVCHILLIKILRLYSSFNWIFFHKRNIRYIFGIYVNLFGHCLNILAVETYTEVVIFLPLFIIFCALKKHNYYVLDRRASVSCNIDKLAILIMFTKHGIVAHSLSKQTIHSENIELRASNK